jgi:hypothetical protein
MRIKTFTLLLMGVCFLFVGCTKRVFVEHDYSYQGHFKAYKSFGFMECPNLDSLIACSDLQESIRQQMQSRGYKLNYRQPDILVTYNIFKDNLRFKGFQQPIIKDWIETEDDDDATYKHGTYNLNEGTLMISLIDSETYSVIWQGYASKLLYDPNAKRNYYKSIVRSIFDQYPLMAAGVRPQVN